METYERIRDLIIRYVDIAPEKISEESRFIEDLGFCSYDFLALFGDLEDEFDIEIDLYDILEIDTVGDALQYVERTFAV